MMWSAGVIRNVPLYVGGCGGESNPCECPHGIWNFGDGVWPLFGRASGLIQHLCACGLGLTSLANLGFAPKGSHTKGHTSQHTHTPLVPNTFILRSMQTC